MTKKQLLVVFDIDETLIQYIDAKSYPLWELHKDKFDSKHYTIKTNNKGQNECILFRPHIEELLNLFKTDKFFKPALWTYSEREYAFDIGNELIEKYNLPQDFFLFRKGSEDIDEDPNEIPKNLRTIYDEYPDMYNTFNTILIDDRFGNINNNSNRYNSIAIQPFAPFGTDKIREILPSEEFSKQLIDNAFVSVIDILNAIKRDINGCTLTDINEGFKTEPVFSSKRVSRMKLNKYIQPFATNFTEIISVGMPYLYNKFIYIPKKHRKYLTKKGGQKMKKIRKNTKKIRKNTKL